MKQTFHYQIEINDNSISFEFYMTKPNHTVDAQDGSLTEESETRRFGIKISYDWTHVDESIELMEMLNNGKMIEAYALSKNIIGPCNNHL